MSAYEYVVDLDPAGIEPPLVERFGVIIQRRFEQLEEQRGEYPTVGGAYDFMDAFEGPYVWEMTDAEFEATPPTLVAFDVLEVDPVQPAGSGRVHVKVAIPH